MTSLQPNLVISKGELRFIVGVYREDAMNLWDLELVQLLKNCLRPSLLLPTVFLNAEIQYLRSKKALLEQSKALEL